MKSLPGDPDSYNSSVDLNLQIVPKIEAPLNSNDGLPAQFNVTLDAASYSELSSQCLDHSQVSSVQSSVSTLSGLGGIGAKIAMRNFHSPAVGRKTFNQQQQQPALSNASSSQWTSDEASSSQDNSSADLSTTHSVESGPSASHNTNRRMSLEVPRFKRH
jgi:hypothetical protein